MRGLTKAGLTLHDFELTTTCDGANIGTTLCSVRPSVILSVTI